MKANSSTSWAPGGAAALGVGGCGAGVSVWAFGLKSSRTSMKDNISLFGQVCELIIVDDLIVFCQATHRPIRQSLIHRPSHHWPTPLVVAVWTRVLAFL